MAGNDLRNITLEIREILLNKEVIAVDQDPLGTQGRRVRDQGDLEVWARKLANDAHAVVLFNRSKSEQTIAVSWVELGLAHDASPAVRDLWAKKDLGRVTGRHAARVGSHDVVMLVVKP